MRARHRADTPAALRSRLTRCARVAALLHHAVYLYAHPDRAGGESLVGATYRERVARFDATVLDEFLATAIEELLAVRAENDREIERVTATMFAPGTTGKIEEMIRREAHGRSLFCDCDGPR